MKTLNNIKEVHVYGGVWAKTSKLYGKQLKYGYRIVIYFKNGTHEQYTTNKLLNTNNFRLPLIFTLFDYGLKDLGDIINTYQQVLNKGIEVTYIPCDEKFTKKKDLLEWLNARVDF